MAKALEQELQVAVDAVRRAGEAVRAIFRTDLEVRQKSGDRGPVTEADLAAERVLLEALQSAFPGDGVLSEETADTPERLSRSRVWIVDPLDGTREFTLGLPEFVLSVALVIDGQARLGVLYNPAAGELFTGVVGRGATLNGAPVRVSQQPTVEGARFLVSRNELEMGMFEAYEGRVELRPMGSVAYKLGLVAAGKADATFTPQPRHEWDLAGGTACLVAAGGRATDGQGRDYTFNRAQTLHHGVAGTNGHLHAAVLELMKP